MLKVNAAISPLGKNISANDVGKTAAFLLSDYAAAITGEIMHVDNGFSIMGGVTPELKELYKGESKSNES